jgi:thymidylate synthase
MSIHLELLEEYPCDSKDQLHAKEAEWIKKMDTLNKNIPGRSIQKWREENREHVLKTKKIYYEEHKEEILTYFRERQQTDKEAIARKRKSYYEDNKDRILQ